jgi:hypothetical protein
MKSSRLAYVGAPGGGGGYEMLRDAGQKHDSSCTYVALEDVVTVRVKLEVFRERGHGEAGIQVDKEVVPLIRKLPCDGAGKTAILAWLGLVMIVRAAVVVAVVVVTIGDWFGNDCCRKESNDRNCESTHDELVQMLDG